MSLFNLVNCEIAEFRLDEICEEGKLVDFFIL